MEQDAHFDDDIQVSMKHLAAANVLIAVRDDGTARLIQTEAQAHEANLDNFTIYTPQDAYMYLRLSEDDRRLLHSFKKRFRATSE